MLAELETKLSRLIPNARLQLTTVPETPLSLWLINDDYPQHALSQAQAAELMEHPPYWCFCWASGLVMAQQMLAHPEQVKGKNILDLGCGSGIVGIAAATAGAKRVVCCDIDPEALKITAANATTNSVDIILSEHLDAFMAEQNCQQWLVCIADVFYDTENLVLLDTLCEHFAEVWVSDSRTKPEQLKQLRFCSEHISNTLPDLDESEQFRHVKMYKKLS